jgi:hypothetical protein
MRKIRYIAVTTKTCILDRNGCKTKSLVFSGKQISEEASKITFADSTSGSKVTVSCKGKIDIDKAAEHAVRSITEMYPGCSTKIFTYELDK